MVKTLLELCAGLLQSHFGDLASAPMQNKSGQEGLYQICKQVTQKFGSNTERDFLGDENNLVMLHLKKI